MQHKIKHNKYATKIIENSNIVCLVPHYDDEAFFIPLLDYQNLSKTTLCFLTTPANPIQAKKRKQESLCFISKFAPPKMNFIDISNQLKIVDNTMALHLEQIFKVLSTSINQANIIIAPSFEGGHPDHDATYLLGLALAQHFNAKIFTYPTYNGCKTHGYFFRMLSPLSETLAIQKKLKASFALRYSINILINYRSQLKTWIGLLPFFTLHLLTKKIGLYSAKKPFKLTKPHKGRLLYERYRRTTWEAFINATKTFCQQHNILLANEF